MPQNKHAEPSAPKHPDPSGVPPLADDLAEAHFSADAAQEAPEAEAPMASLSEAPAPAPKPKADHPAPSEKNPPTGRLAKLKAAVSKWWHNPTARNATLAGVGLGIFIVLAIPPSRYLILNSVGIRSSASVTVLDDSTQQPLKNVEVQLANQTGKTDSSGKVQLGNLKLGTTKITVNRRAFAEVQKKVTIGWGSNPLGDFKLTPTGSRYTFSVSDFMSAKPLAKAEANSDQADAVANEQGELVLTVDANEMTDLPVTFRAEGYRDEVLNLNLDDKSAHAVHMVPARKHVYVSKRSGKYDVYSANLDGSHQTLLLAGSGFERDDMVLVPHPADDVVALVSTRSNLRNRDGYLLSSLTLIDSNDGDLREVTQAERIQINGWVDDKLIYTQVVAGASAAKPDRQKLISFDYKTGTSKELASSNYFNDVVVADGVIYYAPSDAYQTNPVAFYKINPDGNARTNLLNNTVWNVFRTDYKTLQLSVAQEWYSYSLGAAGAVKLKGPPASQVNRLYVDDDSRQHSLWVDNRDGKGVLLNYDVAQGTDTALQTRSGLTSPMSWLNNHYVIYRVKTDQETADYALNLDGGQPRKITDVTNTGGLSQWFYY